MNMLLCVCMYVDDMFIVSSNDKMIISTKNIFNSRFDMKDLRLVDFILGIKIKKKHKMDSF